MVEIMNSLRLFCELLSLIAPNEREELICQIHNEAGKLCYVDDRDQAAILLELIGDQTEDAVLRLLCYKHAVFRAKWCAQAATGGGEGISRAVHLRILQDKQMHAEQDAPAQPPPLDTSEWHALRNLVLETMHTKRLDLSSVPVERYAELISLLEEYLKTGKDKPIDCAAKFVARLCPGVTEEVAEKSAWLVLEKS